MRLGVIGINEKLADLKLRERFAKICQQHFNVDVSAADATPLVVLSTCNRTEVYFSSDDLAATHIQLVDILRQHLDLDFDQKLYSFFGKDCLHHLARVAAGLDSAILAETEIQGQVRIAYETTAKHRPLPHELHFAFQKALKIGKQVRKELPLRRGVPDLEHAILSAASQIFEKPQEARLLFVGASEINHKVLCFMKRKAIGKISLCNKTSDRAVEMARKHDVHALPWDAMSSWREYDWVIFGTKAPDYLISSQGLYDSSMRTQLIIDLSVPRNVDPSIGSPNLSLLNIDQLHDMLRMRRASLADLVADAEALVASATSRLAAAFQQRDASGHRLILIH